MIKFKKLMLLGLIGVFSGALFIGCSNKQENVDKKSNSEETKLSVFIPGYNDPGFKKAYDENIEAFKKANPNIKIDLIGAGWEDFPKMINMIKSNNAPDIMLTGSRRLKQLINMKAIEPLDFYLKSDKKEQYIESVLKTGNVENKQYGLPIGFSSRALYYRKDLIKNPPKNWDDLIKISKEVEKEHPNMKGFAIAGNNSDSTVDQLFNYFYQNEANAYDENGKPVINSPKAVEALSFFTDLYKKYNVVKNPVDVNRGDFSNLFKNEQIAMFISGPWEKNAMKLEPNNPKTPYGVALLPKGKVFGQTLVTDSITISSSSNHKEDAFKFIDFMSSFERQNKFDEAVGFFPIFKEEQKDKRYQTDFLKPFVEMIKYGKPEPQPSVWEDFQNTVVKAIQKSLLGESTPKEALDEAQKQLEQSK